MRQLQLGRSQEDRREGMIATLTDGYAAHYPADSLTLTARSLAPFPLLLPGVP